MFLSDEDNDDDAEGRILTSRPVVELILNDGSAVYLSLSDDLQQVANHPDCHWASGAASVSKRYYVLLHISDEDVARLNGGIRRITINSVPTMIQKQFDDNKLGEQLYKDFMSIK